MSLNFVVSALLVAGAIAQEETFDNDYEQPVNFECPEGQTIKTIYSVHDNVREDRRWRFGCKNTPLNVRPDICYWSEDYINDWDEPVLFICRPNAMIAGIQSVYDNSAKDRRMKVRCCRKPGIKARSCRITDYLNDWDAPMNYTVTKGKVLTGWLSYHDNGREDRRHKMIECILHEVVSIN